jgi:hypothetical protein
LLEEKKNTTIENVLCAARSISSIWNSMRMRCSQFCNGAVQ